MAPYPPMAHPCHTHKLHATIHSYQMTLSAACMDFPLCKLTYSSHLVIVGIYAVYTGGHTHTDTHGHTHTRIHTHPHPPTPHTMCTHHTCTPHTHRTHAHAHTRTARTHSAQMFFAGHPLIAPLVKPHLSVLLI